MKICFFNLNAYSVFNEGSRASVGGTEVQLRNLAIYFSHQSGFEVDFLTGNWGQFSIEEYDGVRVIPAISLKKTLLNYFIAPFSIWRVLGWIDADVYIVSSASLEVGILAFFCLIHKKKFVYRIAHKMDYSGEFIKRHPIAGSFFSYGLRRADMVVAQNHSDQIVLEQKGIPSIVISSGYPIQVDLLEKEARGPILWVARCESWKGPDIFLDIVKRNPDKNFVMICPRQSHEDDLFKKISTQAKKIKNLQFIERVPFAEIQKFFNKAKIFINTSESEGFPNTYLQACMGKTPIISYKVNPDNFIIENNIGYCADGDFDFMIKLIEKISNDNVDWSKKSKNSSEYVLKNHDINKVGSQWKAILEEMLSA